MKRVGSKRSGRVPATIALVSAQPHSFLHDPHLRQSPLIQGLIDRVEHFGYQLEEFNIERDRISPSRLSKVLWTRRVSGVIFTAVMSGVDMPALKWEQIISVELGTTLNEPRLHRASSDHYRSMAMAVDSLLQLGYKRIGLVGSDAADRKTNGRWRKSFYGEFAHKGLSIDIPPIIQPEDDIDADFESWFVRYKPDALLCYKNAHAVIQWLKSRGLRIPQDIGVAHLHLHAIGVTTGEVSGIDQHSQLIAKAAVDLLIGKMEANSYGLPEHPEVVTIAGSWVDGRTTRSALKE